MLADDVYDAVVVATPLERANLLLTGFDMPKVPPREFKRTITTIVAGILRPSYFGVQSMPEGAQSALLSYSIALLEAPYMGLYHFCRFTMTL